MSNDSLLKTAADFAYRELEAQNGDIKSLPFELATFILVYSAQGILDNGGLQYFFESNFEQQLPYPEFVDAYNAISAKEAANALLRAIAHFPFENPHHFEGRRRATMELLWADDDCEFADLDMQLCGNESVWSSLVAFVDSNRERFGLE